MAPPTAVNRTHATRLDPHAPLVVDTHELSRRPGSMLQLVRDVPAPGDLGTVVIGVPAGSPLHLELRLESVVDGVLVSARVRTIAVGECGRCLEPARLEVDVSFAELFLYPVAAPTGRAAQRLKSRPGASRGRAGQSAPAAAGEEDQPALVGDLADLEPSLRDAVVPALPLTPLCSPDCAGLCPQCGARLDDEPTHHHDAHDPRWAGLASLVDPPR